MAIRVGNAPVSWGVFEADRENSPFAAVLDAIAQTGYEGTELGPYGYLPTDPRALDAELESRNLVLASSFVPLELENEAARADAVRTALKVGRLLRSQGVEELILAADEKPFRRKIAGRVPADPSAGLSDAAWRIAAATVHEIARALKDELSMRVVFHHHAGTYIETPAEIDRFLFETDPELVGLLLDTGHAVYGGVDLFALIARHGKRIRYLHLKDASKSMLEEVRTTDLDMEAAWQRGVFCPLGEGVVDFPRVIEELRAQGFSGWAIVEQDVIPNREGKFEPDPTISAKQSRAYLAKSLGL